METFHGVKVTSILFPISPHPPPHATQVLGNTSTSLMEELERERVQCTVLISEPNLKIQFIISYV